MKEKIPAFDFVRALCAICIIINHYSIESNVPFLKKYFYTFASGEGSFGYTLVTIFIIISGALLFYNHENIESTRKFFSSRFISIFPSYYVTWIFAAVGALLFNRSIFRNPIYTFPLTLIGMDGYLANTLPTWRLIGEWFIGAIVVLYLLYPFILLAIKKATFIFALTAMYCFLLSINWAMLEQNPYRNIFSLIFSFVIGMLFIKYKDYAINGKGLYILSTIVFAFIYCVPVGIDINLSSHIAGFSLFCLLFGMGTQLMKNDIISGFIRRISTVSYEMFLIQRIVIVYTLKFLHPHNVLNHGAILALVIFVTYVGAFLIRLIRNRVVSFIMFPDILKNTKE